jgi:hypothetical protein
LRLKKFRRNILFWRNGVTLSHPDKHQAPESHGGELLGFKLAHHFGVWAFSDEFHALTVAVKGGSVVGATEIALPKAVPPRQVDAPMWAVVPKRLYVIVFVSEKRDVLVHDSEANRLLPPNVLVRNCRVPVFAQSICWYLATPVIRVVWLYEGGRVVSMIAPRILLPTAGIAAANFTQRFKKPHVYLRIYNPLILRRDLSEILA